MKKRHGILLVFFSMIIIILFISFVSSPHSKSNFFYSAFINELTGSSQTSDALLLMMSTEIPQLKENLKESDIEPPNLSDLFFEITSGVTPNDFTSLLGLELPGFNSYSNEMNIARAGTDMPIESPPPDFEKLLKEEKKDNPDKDQSKPEKENTENQTKANVFIYHSHAWEAFFPLLKENSSEASSTNQKKNVVLVGSMLTEQLEKRGISTSHDTTNVTEELHEKGWNYYDSYRFSRLTIEEVTSINKTLKYFIDIHRDALRKDSTTTTINGKDYAKLYFIVGVEHENYIKNLEFVEELNKKIEESYPGLSKGIYKKDRSEGNGVYNQDISERSILIEIGGVDNNREELSNTSKVLAEIISEYIKSIGKV
ncbi:stage II sporulation protein P [Virgibacillus necropolis]|uniref:Stage II sporulation protein P n=1 Tax=Virgibacillus necropolis TaxID=163877 RepID=A0A221MDE9_9BACI|nr:stage II sporulation protein P [Virgibacillus necropolis]ASN05632.1 stage II sporulation protein P [Virgibacillus necropolis]